jgi:hypothetical protein
MDRRFRHPGKLNGSIEGDIPLAGLVLQKPPRLVAVGLLGKVGENFFSTRRIDRRCFKVG